VSRALFAALALASCANSTGFIIAAQTLDTLGAAVEETHARMEAKALRGEVTPEQVAAWNLFLDKFQRAYPPAVQLWKLGRHTNDAALTGRSSEIIAALLAELVPLARVVGVSLSTGGTP
jgi:hypothetical protein